MLYKYFAKKGIETVEGLIEAQSESEAVEKLSQSGILPVRLEKAAALPKAETQARIKKPSARIASRQITVFSRELASLLKSGVPILSALDIIREQSENLRLKEIVTDIRNAIKDGAAFSSGIARYPKVFSSLYVAMVKAGEDSGALAESLLRITEYRVKEEEMFSKLRIAMAYPALMALVGLATVIFMLTFVLPRLTKIFVDLGRELPLATQILINLSQGLVRGWFWIGLIITAMFFVIRQEVKTKPGKRTLSVLQLHFPVLGKIMLKAELSRFCRTLELLIRSGIPILKSIDITIPVLENEVIKEQLNRSYKELEQGGSFGKSLKKSKVFPLFMTNLLVIGEESGKLEGALAEIANLYERDTDEAIRIMGSLLEPLMILIMGLIVGFIVVAMLLPIFDISPTG